ncbi:MAG: hypothetical protein AAGA96_09945 [Verrucomicrobiota bacterium]
MRVIPSLLLVVLTGSTLPQLHAENTLEPLMAKPKKVVLSEDFETPFELNKARDTWSQRQATRWAVEDGVLRGQPSTPENQAAKSHHRGLEARLSVPATPAECIAKFSIRFLEGEETTIVPFVEFGHHIIRLRFDSKEGVSLLADYESMKVAEDQSFIYQPGKWMHLLAELKGDEFVIQIQDGPTLYGKHPVIPNPAPSGGNGFGTAGLRGGTVEIDNLTLWSVSEEDHSNWKSTRAQFPPFEPVQVREKPKK